MGRERSNIRDGYKRATGNEGGKQILESVKGFAHGRKVDEDLVFSLLVDANFKNN